MSASRAAIERFVKKNNVKPAKAAKATGYGPSGKAGYKRIEDEGGGQAERAWGDAAQAAYLRRRKAGR